MKLSDFDFKPDYTKSEDDIAEKFYIPAMRCSKNYDRISGYFGSTIYIIAWSALQDFVNNGGKMRVICSPCISERDKQALNEGYQSLNDASIKDSLEKELEELFSNPYLVKPSRVLAGLVAEGILDIKIAEPANKTEPELKRLFHDKVGIFSDNYGNSVGFRGSMNETFQGLSEDGNSESIDVFPDWLEARDKQRTDNAKYYFEKLWSKTDENIKVYDFPEAVKKKLIDKSNGYDWKELAREISTSISLEKKWRPDKKRYDKPPRPHQVEALENWVKNSRCGILEHATGSGKTYTAICAIRDAFNRQLPVLVLVPSKELLYQWKKEISSYISDIEISFLLCGDGNNNWKKDDTLKLWTRNTAGLNKVTIAIMDTAASDNFIERLSSDNHFLLVVDEVHRIGSPARRNFLEKVNPPERLGLSATPIRYGDPEGTEALFSYFHGIIEPVFTLNDAIQSDVLTKYFYYPLMVYLSESEQERWDELTSEINRLIAVYGKKGESVDDIINKNDRLQMKLIERSRILKQAEGKIELALDTIKENYSPGQKWIIYCDNQNQLNQVLTLLLNNRFDAYEYHSEMKGDRVQTLDYFSSNGGILVSIRCLDEGVDIPETTHALILASSKNPREFIQRRGRILRKADGKHFAYLYDAVVVPYRNHDDNDRSNSIIEAELARAIQFGDWAENPNCISQLKVLALKFGIEYEKINGGYDYDESRDE